MTLPTGWTLSEWQHAYGKAQLDPKTTLGELRDTLSADDPAWIHIVSQTELNAQIATLTSPSEQPLFGIPFVVKDNIDVAGLPTTAACPAYSYTAERDATTVARLKAAGAIVLAKTKPLAIAFL